MWPVLLVLALVGGQGAAKPAEPKPAIKEIKIGTGAKAANGDLVTVHFIAATSAGKEIGNSERRGLPYKFVVGDAKSPKYLDVSVRGMQVGGERRVTLPPALAFGAKGAPPVVGPNATLVLTIKLLGISKTGEPHLLPLDSVEWLRQASPSMEPLLCCHG
jgi:FKBP-type peptidyl-prolyl cis-trans isomerase